MNLASLLESLRRNLKGVVLFSYVVLALVVAFDVVRVFALAGHGHEAAAGAAGHASEHAAGHGAAFWARMHYLAENVPAFWAVFGLSGCLLLVIVSKTYGHYGVSEEEGYYDE